jgi:hypothetical protein
MLWPKNSIFANNAGQLVVDYVATGCHLEFFPTYPQSSTHNILQHAVTCPQLEEPRSCHIDARVTRDANGLFSRAA